MTKPATKPRVVWFCPVCKCDHTAPPSQSTPLKEVVMANHAAVKQRRDRENN